MTIVTTIHAPPQHTRAHIHVPPPPPDTSPRGAGVAGEGDAWDFGLGAGFYLNATQPQWAAHYRMADFITQVCCDVV